ICVKNRGERWAAVGEETANVISLSDLYLRAAVRNENHFRRPFISHLFEHILLGGMVPHIETTTHRKSHERPRTAVPLYQLLLGARPLPARGRGMARPRGPDALLRPLRPGAEGVDLLRGRRHLAHLRRPRRVLRFRSRAPP